MKVSFGELLENIDSSPRVIKGKRITNLDDLPFPDLELYKNFKAIMEKEIANFFPMVPPFGSVIASRGCHCNSFCKPCEDMIFGRGVRYRSIDNVIKEINYLVTKYGVKTVLLQDDTFTDRKERAIEFCKKIKKLNVYWCATSRVNTIDEELAKNMRDSGCVCIYFGFESGNQRVLNLLRKRNIT